MSYPPVFEDTSTDNKFEFTDMPNDDKIDRATEANHDVDFASIGPEHNHPRQQALPATKFSLLPRV